VQAEVACLLQASRFLIPAGFLAEQATWDASKAFFDILPSVNALGLISFICIKL
jgi:hypothetical protein